MALDTLSNLLELDEELAVLLSPRCSGGPRLLSLDWPDEEAMAEVPVWAKGSGRCSRWWWKLSRGRPLHPHRDASRSAPRHVPTVKALSETSNPLAHRQTLNTLSGIRIPVHLIVHPITPTNMSTSRRTQVLYK